MKKKSLLCMLVIMMTGFAGVCLTSCGDDGDEGDPYGITDPYGYGNPSGYGDYGGGSDDGSYGGGSDDGGYGGGSDDGGYGGGSDDGGNTGNNGSVPDAPTGVTVSNEGSAMVPMVTVRWNSVSGATSYRIYRSSSANGSYSRIGEASTYYTSYVDNNAPKSGSAYYKVKAVNSYGESSFSNFAQYTPVSNDEAFEPVYTYGNCTVSGTKMTLRWTYKTGTGIGKATEAKLSVLNPYSQEWVYTELSPTATSASFDFSNKIDDQGYVKAGIIVSNAKGSYTAGAKIYDTNNKKWIN